MDTNFVKANKSKFDAEDEKIIIDFVKNNDILYNVKHRQYRDREAKNRLWLVLAKKLNKDDGIPIHTATIKLAQKHLFTRFFVGSTQINEQNTSKNLTAVLGVIALTIVVVVMKRWRSMRDYFIRSREKKSGGSGASGAVAKRDESLIFLLQTSMLKTQTTINLGKYFVEANNSKFYAEEDEKLIDFVKNNDVLYNVKHRQYRDREAKKRLWLVLAKKLNKDVGAVMKRWRSMRDYFIRSRVKNSIGSAASAAVSKRDESLLFLLKTSLLKRKTSTNLEIAIEATSLSHEDAMTYMSDNVSFVSSDVDDRCEYGRYESNGSSTFLEPKPKKISTSSGTDESLHEFLDYHPKPSVCIARKSDDDVQLFFETMAATVRGFPRFEIAQLKMNIANLVGEVELRLSKETPDKFCYDEVESIEELILN